MIARKSSSLLSNKEHAHEIQAFKTEPVKQNDYLTSVNMYTRLGTVDVQLVEFLICMIIIVDTHVNIYVGATSIKTLEEKKWFEIFVFYP